VIDTTELTLEDQIGQIVALAQEKIRETSLTA
jgi:hypothetical protein